MASLTDRIGMARILRMALVLSVLVYPLLAILVLGPPKWREPWVPSEQDKAILLVALGILALAEFVAGRLVGSLRRPPRFMAAAADPVAFGFQRFILGLALIDGGAILGLVGSFTTRDPRYAITFAVPAILLMLQVPGLSPPGADDSQQ